MTPGDGPTGDERESWPRERVSAENLERSRVERSLLEDLISRLDGERFGDWYRRREFERNIREGRPQFNQPNVRPPERQSPSRLLRCHRKEFYREHTAPAESRRPEGVLWYGARVETDVVVPFLRDVAGPEFIVCDSMWVDFTEPGDEYDLQIQGATDPVFVDVESQPQLLTEIKTVGSLESLDVPRRHHRAQVHAYLRGLSVEHESEVREAVVVYVQRDDLAVRTFTVTFDPAFWRETVLEWAEEDTRYRSGDDLPPASPEAHWECRYCDYRQRCGQTDAPFTDTGPTGLLPLTEEYPRTRLTEYLRAHSRARLTPTLAFHHPDLAAAHGAYDWLCPVCDGAVGVFEVEWDGDTDRPPLCPTCGEDGVTAVLSGPAPEAQLDGEDDPDEWEDPDDQEAE